MMEKHVISDHPHIPTHHSPFLSDHPHIPTHHSPSLTPTDNRRDNNSENCNIEIVDYQE